MSTMSPFNPTGGKLRCDRWGDGKFGASRGTDDDGNPRIHKGVDLLGKPGSYVCATQAGVVVRTGAPYGDGKPWDCYLLIREVSGAEWRLFYVKPLPGIVGTTVYRGQAVATLADVGAKYGVHPTKKRMRPHCHAEKWINGERVDPEIAL